MENKIQIFEHEKFGKIRTVIVDGKIHFVAVDVCLALEIKNSRDALTRLESDEKMTIDLTGSHSGKRGGAQFMTVVNEPGLYRLIFSSRKKEALEFQRWVYHEVLPSIHKTCLYSIEQIVEQFLKSATSALPVQMCVYVLEMNNVNVKIGITSNFFKRKRSIETGSGLKVIRYFNTHYINEKYARLIESLCHEIFSSSKLNGEFFSVEFDEACKVVEYFAKLVAAAPIVSDLKRGGKILKLVDRKFD